MKKIKNIAIIITLGIILFLSYQGFFNLPTDPLKLAKLQTNIGISYLVLLALLLVKLKFK